MFFWSFLNVEKNKHFITSVENLCVRLLPNMLEQRLRNEDENYVAYMFNNCLEKMPDFHAYYVRYCSNTNIAHVTDRFVQCWVFSPGCGWFLFRGCFRLGRVLSWRPLSIYNVNTSRYWFRRSVVTFVNIRNYYIKTTLYISIAACMNIIISENIMCFTHKNQNIV